MPAGSQCLSSPSLSGPQRTIVLLEPDDAVREALSLSLELAGFEVIALASNIEIEAALWPHRPLVDLVVVDAELYEAELEWQLRCADQLDIAIPVILTTSRLRPRLPPGGETHAILAKPFGADELFACVVNVLSGTGRMRSARGT